MECEHVEEMMETYKDYDGPLYGDHCGSWAPHAPHDGCMGIMCDYGCNAEEF